MTTSQQIQAVDAEGNGIRVVFSRQGDRFAHRVERLAEHQVMCVWQSVEGGDRDLWPPSPPLQHLTVESRGDRQAVALLVGAAGTAHWSVSVEADSRKGEAVFDVACRLSGQRGALSSCYRCEPPASHSDALVAVAVDPQRLPTVVQRRQDDCAIVPQADDEFRGTTVRWAYRICCA